MNKSIIFSVLVSLFLLSSCGVGTYSVSSGIDDKAAISVAATQKKVQAVVDVDGTKYNVEAVYHQDFKKMRDIKKTAANTIYVTPGQHQIKVYNALDTTTPVVSKTIILSSGDHRVIDL